MNGEIKCYKKKSVIPSFCDVRDRYEHFRSRCTLENPNYLVAKLINK